MKDRLFIPLSAGSRLYYASRRWYILGRPRWHVRHGVRDGHALALDVLAHHLFIILWYLSLVDPRSSLVLSAGAGDVSGTHFHVFKPPFLPL